MKKHASLAFLTAGLLAAGIFFLAALTQGQGTTTVVGGAGGSPGGSNTNVQFNNNGSLGGISALSWSSPTLSFGGVNGANFSIVSNGSNTNTLAITNGSSSHVVFNVDAGSTNVTTVGDTSAGTGALNAVAYKTSANCSSSASPAVCSGAPAGSVVVAAAATTVTVNTTAVSANSQILLTRDDSLGTKLSVTCNTATVMGEMKVSARTSGTSFTITVQTAPATNPGCISYSILN